MINDAQNQPEEKKVNPTLIYGILVAALLGTWGYIILDKSKTKEQITTLTTQNATVSSEKNEVQELYNASLTRLDSLMGENQTINDQLEGNNKEIATLKSEIQKIMANKNATSSELARARRMIGELNGRIQNLAAEVDRLKGENQELTSTNEKISAEKQAVEQNLAATAKAKEVIKKNLEETRDIASTLHVSGIKIAAIDDRSRGREKETSAAKKVDKLRISFDVDPNRLASNGEKELFVIITAPDGKVVVIPGGGSGNFTTREDGEKEFSAKVSVQYENANKVPVSFDWRQTDRFQKGNFKIEVYHNGYKIGEGIRSLK